MLKIYNYPRSLKKTEMYTAKVWTVSNPEDVKELPVFWSKVGSFVSLEFDEPVMIEFTIHREKSLSQDNIFVRPTNLGIKADVNDRKFVFKMTEARNLKIDPEGFTAELDLFVYANKPEKAEDIPNAEDENVIFFKAGQAYEVAQLEVPTNTTVYIEGGAVVRGAIHAANGENVKIMGRGVLDGGYYVRDVDKQIHTVQLENCKNSLIKDIIILHPMVWTVVLGKCDGIHIDNIRELGYEMSSDGIDICGTKNVLIENCCIKVNDDCVVLKAFANHSCGTMAWDYDVENIHVRNCILGTTVNGAIMEIGHEFCCERVNNVVFENIDVVGQHGFGSVFSIQDCDAAKITNVLWDNIRIEHCYSALINFRIMDSMYSHTGIRGHVDGVTVRNVDWTAYNYNIGYTACRIAGYDKDHMVKNVSLENIKINGKKVDNIDELYVMTNHTENITLK